MRPRFNTKRLFAICYLFLLTVGVYNTALLPGRTVLPADLNYIFESRSGDQCGADAFALEQRVGSDCRSVNHLRFQ